MKRRGVSPLIAAVLLIAFTMAVAAILTAWITQFTKSKQELAQTASEKTECVYKGISIKDQYCAWDENTGVFRVYVVNVGSAPVSLKKVYVEEGGKKSLPGVLNVTKEPGLDVDEEGFFYINVSNLHDPDNPDSLMTLTDGPDKVILETECESVTASVEVPVVGWTSFSYGNEEPFLGP